jgi:hypothetical protein
MSYSPHNHELFETNGLHLQKAFSVLGTRGQTDKKPVVGLHS